VSFEFSASEKETKNGPAALTSVMRMAFLLVPLPRRRSGRSLFLHRFFLLFRQELGYGLSGF